MGLANGAHWVAWFVTSSMSYNDSFDNILLAAKFSETNLSFRLYRVIFINVINADLLHDFKVSKAYVCSLMGNTVATFCYSYLHLRAYYSDFRMYCIKKNWGL